MMLDHLRKILIPLSAGLLLVSCSSDEVATAGSEMKFDISDVSRAAVTTATGMTANPFALFGDMIPADIPENQSAITVVYNNTPVTYINSSWTTPGQEFWYYNHVHSFVAIHPANVLSATSADIQYSNSRLSFTYTLPSDPSQISDILTATHRRKYVDQRVYDRNGMVTGGTANVVYLQFTHLMSQLNVAPLFYDNTMTEDTFLEFYKFELKGIKDRATFKVLPAPLLTNNQTDDRVVEISAAANSQREISIDFSTPVRVYNNNRNTPLFSYSDAVIMLPQEFESSSEAQIVLTYSINGSAELNKVVLPLSNSKWDADKSYTYRFSINRTGMLMEPTTITEWDPHNVGNIDAY